MTERDPHRNNDVVIEFCVPDFAPVKAFYQKLGFIVVRDEPPSMIEGGFLLLTLDNARLQFYGGNERVNNHHYFKKFPVTSPRGYGVEVVIAVKDIQAVYERAQSEMPDAIIVPLQDREWGKTDFRLTDPFGFYLRFTS